MNKETREELNQAIKQYNAAQQDKENRVNMQDVLTEIGSLDNEEVQKNIEILKSKTENGEQY